MITLYYVNMGGNTTELYVNENDSFYTINNMYYRVNEIEDKAFEILRVIYDNKILDLNSTPAENRIPDGSKLYYLVTRSILAE